ncbi:MAG: hypothetical protein WCK53_04925 [Methanomicrobiales archaeon]
MGFIELKYDFVEIILFFTFPRAPDPYTPDASHEAVISTTTTDDHPSRSA